MKLILPLLLFSSSPGFAIGLYFVEPNIECTVIKVRSTRPFFGIKEFPKLYQSINNDPFKSKLLIAGKEFPQLKPEILQKSDTFEKILIGNSDEKLILELTGKPLSRNGVIKADNVILGDITCH